MSCCFCSKQPPNEEHPFLLPEFELVIEAEDTKSPSSDDEETDEAAEKRRKEEAARLESEQSGELASVAEADLMQFAATNKDPIFSKFKKRVDRHKDQVCRNLCMYVTINKLIFLGFTVRPRWRSTLDIRKVHS